MPETGRPSLFTGERYATEAGLYDFGARWYDAVTGRFLSVDSIVQSIADPQTLKPYSYVGNDPVNRIDPDGIDFFEWLGREGAKTVEEYLVQ